MTNLFSVGVAFVLAFFPSTAVAEVETVYVPQGLSSTQILWMAKLMNCESDVWEGAVNPIDLDGTSSNGLLQFKQSTYDAFTVKYGIEGDIMDGTSQIDIVTYWILNPGEVDFTKQFPNCVRQLGLPPKSEPKVGIEPDIP